MIDPFRSYYNIVTNMVLVLLQLATGYFLTKTYKAFLKDSIQKQKVCLTGIVYCVVCIFLMYVLYETTWGNIVAYAAAFIAAFIFYYLIDRENIRVKIYLTVTCYIIRWLILGISVRVNVFIDGIMSYIYERKIDYANYDAINLAYFLKYIICSISDVLVYVVIQWYFVKKLTEIYSNKQKELTWRELVLLLVPSLVGGSSYVLNMMYIQKYADTGSMILFGIKYAGFVWILYFIILLAAILITVSFYQQIQENQIYEVKSLMLENSVKDIQLHITEVENIYSQIRGIKHDINNHAAVLSGLIEKGDTEEAFKYLKSFNDIACTSDFIIKTGNPVTDIVINEKMKEAEQKGVEFISDFHYPIESGLNAFDVSIVLSNALSNAVEAVEDGGFINISSYKNKNVYLITVTNSFNGTLISCEETRFPKSSKDDNKVHGIGLQNIKMVADKYLGDAKLEQKDDTVVLTVMLKSMDLKV